MRSRSGPDAPTRSVDERDAGPTHGARPYLSPPSRTAFSSERPLYHGTPVRPLCSACIPRRGRTCRGFVASACGAFRGGRMGPRSALCLPRVAGPTRFYRRQYGFYCEHQLVSQRVRWDGGDDSHKDAAFGRSKLPPRADPYAIQGHQCLYSGILTHPFRCRSYVAPVIIGSGNSQYWVQVDTGSSDFVSSPSVRPSVHGRSLTCSLVVGHRDDVFVFAMQPSRRSKV